MVIAHEWLTNVAGSEMVMKAMAELYPSAEIVCAVADPGLARRFLPGRRVRSLLDPRLPGILAHWSRYAPLMLARWSRLRLDCDLLLVSSHFGAHRATMRTDAPSVVYYHSPMRIAWRLDIESGRLPAAARPVASRLLPAVRRFDAEAAAHPDVLVANSSATARRIEEVYRRPATVVHPPVPVPADLQARPPAPPQEPYYLYFGRLVAYKRPDLAVTACRELGRRLVVAGYGPMLESLRRLSGPATRFVERPDDDEKWRLLAGARALLFPGEEDFGIVAVEALAAGTPVIGLGRGGLVDSVTGPELGELFEPAGHQAMVAAMRRFESRRFDPDTLRRGASRFSPAAFKAQMTGLLERNRMPLPAGAGR